MKPPDGKIVDAVKKLPGVSYVLTVTTYLGAMALGKEELTGWPLIAACTACAISYVIGSALDKPLYDRLYGPRTMRSWLPYANELRRARDNLAKHLFPTHNVSSYLEAVDRKLLADPDLREGEKLPGLYTLASSAAKSSKLWEKKIAVWHDISKAARSLLVLSSFFLLFLAATAAFSSAVPPAMSQALARMGFFGTFIPYAAAFPAMLWAFLSLRAKHHVLLYELVTSDAQTLRLSNGDRVLVVPETRLPSDA